MPAMADMYGCSLLAMAIRFHSCCQTAGLPAKVGTLLGPGGTTYSPIVVLLFMNNDTNLRLKKLLKSSVYNKNHNELLYVAAYDGQSWFMSLNVMM